MTGWSNVHVSGWNHRVRSFRGWLHWIKTFSEPDRGLQSLEVVERDSFAISKSFAFFFASLLLALSEVLIFIFYLDVENVWEIESKRKRKLVYYLSFLLFRISVSLLRKWRKRKIHQIFKFWLCLNLCEEVLFFSLLFRCVCTLNNIWVCEQV